jgi:hypothetical protein
LSRCSGASAANFSEWRRVRKRVAPPIGCNRQDCVDLGGRLAAGKYRLLQPDAILAREIKDKGLARPHRDSPVG